MVILLISLILISSTFGQIALAKDITPEAHHVIAIDSKTKKVLYEKRGYENVAMASTTKMITSLVAINYGNLDDIVTVSKIATSVRGAKVGLRTGEKITLRELVWGLMFKSGNDAAIAIAEHLGGSVEGFSVLMNDFAKTIGIIDSNFQSPHGLDSANHFSSAYDLAILGATAMENKVFAEIVSTKEISKSSTGFSRDYRNINKILWKIPNANGIKTGYTGQAGKCLVTSIKEKDRNIIIVVLNCPQRWDVTSRVYEHVKKDYN
ncbi:MAG: D-alanyl-D-alanine carboxypeptidase family protein [Sarcina sp.]